MPNNAQASGRTDTPLDQERVVRVFISSTFRDFNQERQLLVNQVFPELRRRARERFVDVVEVDLRWGITQEEAERGEVLPICLREIERSRPYFIGLLGERYGWVPSEGQYPTRVLEEHSWLGEHVGGKSLTELEILHGVLNAPEMAGRAFFYFRDAAYAQAYGAEFISASLEDAAKLVNLKERIQRSGFPLVRNYPSPRELADQVCEDLWKLIDTQFPEDEVPDQFERERRMHAAYAKQRIGLHIGGEMLVESIAHRLTQAKNGAGDALTRVTVITGQSGGGKSTLMANWLARHRTTHPNDLVFDHYLGCTADSGHPELLVRRLIQWIQRVTKSIAQSPDATFRKDEIPAEKEKLYEALPQWLGTLSEYARQHGAQAIIAIDALDKLSHEKHIPWLPIYVPPYVHVVVSTLDGEAMKACNERGWFALAVPALEQQQREEFISQYLGRFTRKLSANEIKAILAHPLSALPLYLKVLLDELRYASSHETLVESLQTYLSCTSIEDLYGQVLERVENQCGKAAVQSAMTSLWASRAGLSQTELLAMHALPPAVWSAIRLQLDDAIYDEGGLMRFTHDYMRAAVGGRYVPTQDLKHQAHKELARWWEMQDLDTQANRVLDELPFQLASATEWKHLQATLLSELFGVKILRLVENKVLLHYWIDVEKELNCDLDSQYFLAWSQWEVAKGRDEAAAYVAELLVLFLNYAGRFNGSIKELLNFKLSVDQASGEMNRILDSYIQRAGLLSVCGDNSQAEVFARRAIDITITSDLDLWQRAEAQGQLGLILYSSRKWDLAEVALRESLRLIPSNARDSLVSYNISLADLLTDIGRFDEALKLYLDILPAIRGYSDPTQLYLIYHSISILFKRICRWDEAYQFAFESLKGREITFGIDHISTALSLNTCASLEINGGQYSLAASLLSKALDSCVRTYGKSHSTCKEIEWNLRVCRRMRITKIIAGAILFSIYALPLALIVWLLGWWIAIGFSLIFGVSDGFFGPKKVSVRLYGILLKITFRILIGYPSRVPTLNNPLHSCKPL